MKHIVEIKDEDLMDGCSSCPMNYDYIYCNASAEEGEDPMIGWLIDGGKDERPKDCPLLPLSCASCPEMDNPDSYISHLQSALKWHDEHVPRPTNPRNTCVVLQGEKPPEEVMFVREGGGVTHYLPDDAGTCQNIAELNREGVSGYFFVCSECGLAVHADRDINKTNYTCRKPDGSIDLRTFNSGGEYKFERCPRCGRKVTE